jgi:hypothetical protein
MSDWLDVVRAANPVPRPRPFDADVRQRITAAIVQDDPAESPRVLAAALEPARHGNRRRRRLRGGRPLVVIVLLCVAGGTSAAAASGLFDGPAAVHAPATPTLAAGVAVAGGVLVLATGMSDRANANPRAFELTWTKPAA